LITRMPGLARMTLVDADRYEAKNLQSQDIQPSDIASRSCRRPPRATAQPETGGWRLRAQLEHVPLGRLRAMILALDSRRLAGSPTKSGLAARRALG
jgi:hypothetical protein